MTPKTYRPRGFTLVELLVVIVIIGILASLTTAAVINALKAAQRTAIQTEITTMAQGMEAYKNKYGSYPPSSKDQLIKHLQQVFINASATEINSIPDLQTPAEVLVFALQGYAKNKRQPITGIEDRDNFFEFKPDRLSNPAVLTPRTSTSTPLQKSSYIAPKTTNTYYLYFNTSRYQKSISPDSYTVPAGNGTGGPVYPYLTGPGNPKPYANPQSFQIISAGLDGDYGAGSPDKYFPAGTNYSAGDNDNLTNFSPNALGDDRP